MKLLIPVRRSIGRRNPVIAHHRRLASSVQRHNYDSIPKVRLIHQPPYTMLMWFRNLLYNSRELPFLHKPSSWLSLWRSASAL